MYLHTNLMDLTRFLEGNTIVFEIEYSLFKNLLMSVDIKTLSITAVFPSIFILLMWELSTWRSWNTITYSYFGLVT